MADNFQLKAVISAVDKITPTLKSITRSVRVARKALGDIGSASRQIMGTIGLPAGLGFAALAYGVKAATASIMDYGGAVQDASEKTGLNTQLLQAMRYQASQTGMAAEDLDEAMVKLNKGMAEAAAGKDQSFAALMAKMKIPLRDAQGGITSIASALPLIAESFKKTEDPALRTRMVMELFGKSGAKLIPFLKDGAEGFTNMIAEVHRLGIMIDDDAITSLDRMGKGVSTISAQLRGQWGQLMGAIAPIITPIIESLREWIVANKDLIRANLTKFIGDVAEGIKSIDWEKFRADIIDVKDAILGFVEKVGGMKNVMIGFGIGLLAGPLAALLSIGAAVARLGIGLGMLLFRFRATATGYAVMGAIPAINSAVGASFIWLRGQALAVMLALRMGGVAGLASAALGAIGSAVLRLGSLFAGAAKGVLLLGRALLLSPLGIVLALGTAAFLVWKNWDWLKGKFSGFFNWIGEKFKLAVQWVASLVPDWVKDLVTGDGVKGLSTSSQSGRAPLTASIAARQAMGAGAAAQRGEVLMRFENAPQGFRVETVKDRSLGFDLNPDVGYRSFAYGAP